MTKQAEIVSNGYGRYYISFGVTRSRQDYATPANAKRAAEAKGYTVVGDMPDPNAVSIADLVKVVPYTNGERITVVLYGATVIGAVDEVNSVLKRLGFKPVRITYNMMNRDAGPIVIDEDTPSYCDVGSESYWSM